MISTQLESTSVPNFRKILKENLPQPMIHFTGRILRPVEAWREFAFDAVRYIRVSTSRDGTVSKHDGFTSLEAQLTKDYHRIEKGLSLSGPKRPFGSAVQKRIQQLLPAAKDHDPDASFVRYSAEALAALEVWNLSGEIATNVSPDGSGFIAEIDESVLSGFFETRRSVRHFDQHRVVDIETIKRAAALAQNTPSVCNRQAGRLHVYTNSDDISRILSHQNGNSGFGDEVPAVAVVSVDSRLFTGINERNQRWVDGGLYAMSFVWGLHGLGLQTCMLNWSMNHRQSNDLREEAGIPGHQDIIALIAIGHGAENHRVARSERRELDDVLKIHS